MNSPATSHITSSKFFKKTPPVPEEIFLLHLLPFPINHHVAHKAHVIRKDGKIDSFLSSPAFAEDLDLL